MVFTKRLREGVRNGRITCSVRVWTAPHVKAGGRYPMESGHIVVDSIVRIRMADITSDLARESGFESVKDLLETAKHGRGRNVYLVRFHYLAPGAWDIPRAAAVEKHEKQERAERLRRIRESSPPLSAARSKRDR